MKRLLAHAALVLVLAGGLAGCAGHLARRSAPTGHIARVQPAGAVAAPATVKSKPTTAPTGASPDATLVAVQQQLVQLNSTMAAINTNITQADKAADSDNQ